MTHHLVLNIVLIVSTNYAHESRGRFPSSSSSSLWFSSIKVIKFTDRKYVNNVPYRTIVGACGTCELIWDLIYDIVCLISPCGRIARRG